MNDSTAIDDKELLYRKVSVNSGWYDPDRSELKPDAFKPRSDDTEGISIDRAASSAHPEFRSVEEAAVGQSARGYYVAVLIVGDLRAEGFTIVSDSIERNPGHVLLTDLTYKNRKTTRSREVMLQLAHELVVRVEGPFHVKAGEKE